MPTVELNRPARICGSLVAICAWSGLLLQFPLSIALSRSNGMSPAGAVITFFSFFTVVTNLLIALCLTLFVSGSSLPLARWSAKASMQSALAIYIGVVGAVYSLILRHLWDPEGLQKTADILLHDVVPLLYVAYWLSFVAKLKLPWTSVLFWTIYPVCYLIYTLVRGALTGWYPYPFVNVASLGYSRAMTNSLLLLLIFLLLSLLVVAFSRRGGRIIRSIPGK